MGIARAIPVAAAERRVLPASRASLEPGRAFVRSVLRGEGWEGESLERVVLAVSEALTNAVEHGSRPGAPVAIEVAASSRRAGVRVVDGGRPGSGTPAPLRAAPPPTSEHGRGLIIMGALADRLEVRRAGRGTAVRMVFAPRTAAPRRRA